MVTTINLPNGYNKPATKTEEAKDISFTTIMDYAFDGAIKALSFLLCAEAIAADFPILLSISS